MEEEKEDNKTFREYIKYKFGNKALKEYETYKSKILLKYLKILETTKAKLDN